MKTRSTWRKRFTALVTSTILTSSLLVPSYADDLNANSRGPSQTKTPIEHVIVIFGENISFDHYFATYPKATNPNGQPKFVAADDTPTVNGLSDGLLNNNPNLKQPFRLDRTEAFTCDMDHGYTDEQKAVDGGLMDLFVQAVGRSGVGCRPDGSSVMGYYDGNTVTALWNYAQHYAMNDNSFNTVFGPSTPGAINLISGQTGNGTLITFSGGHQTGTTQTTDTGDTDPAFDDCGADAGGTKNTTTLQMNSKNVGDLLNAKGLTWGFFEGGFRPTVPAVLNSDGTTNKPAVCGSQHTFAAQVANPTAPNNPSPTDIHTVQITDYVPHHQPFQYYASTRNPHHLPPSSVSKIGQTDQANHQYEMSDFFDALNHGNLPAVSYLKAPAYQDAHPANSDPLDEQTFVVQVINALQKSKFWDSTAVIINYDDSDGWYDHVVGPIVNPSISSADSFVPLNPPTGSVPPKSATGPSQIATSGVCATPGSTAANANPAESRCGYGPRLPFMVISPWAKENFVDHTLTDQTSSLRFIEENWDLGFIDGPTALPPGQPLGGQSYDQLAGSIMNMFDFTSHPNTTPLILDETTGTVVSGDNGHGRGQGGNNQ